ncbi:MAG: hypothetical protein KGL39_12195 [Patescibacteria group bacterium]|nr:hypothetical protein [Patescibacteria group bacterium]
MTNAIFQQCMARFQALWPERKPTRETLEAYWFALHDLDDTVFEIAVAECLKTCTFYPKPAEILAKTREVLQRFSLLPPEPELAWGEVMLALQHYHPDLGWLSDQNENGVRVPNGQSRLSPLVEQAAKVVGGINRICMASERELGFIRREFLDFYSPKREAELSYGGLMTQALPERKTVLIGEGR